MTMLTWCDGGSTGGGAGPVLAAPGSNSGKA